MQDRIVVQILKSPYVSGGGAEGKEEKSKLERWQAREDEGLG